MEEQQGRAVGLLRVSSQGDREAERFGSPDEQLARIKEACKRENLTLVKVFSEINVSGGAPLSKRPGLGQAVEMIEDGKADVLTVGYFDRLFRSLRVQWEVADRVEAAGGRVLAADFGEVSNKTAAQWVTTGMLGFIAEYHRRNTGERTKAAQKVAVEEKGRPPHPLIPGFRRTEHGDVIRDPETAPLIERAFEMRADGQSLREVGRFLAEHGIKRGSLNSTALMFRNRMVIGEIHYRGWEGQCPALIDRELFERVQRTVGAPRGRYSKSERLLARLNVLHCATCGGRMSASLKSVKEKSYPFYRCTAVNCSRRATISAPLVEVLVTDEVKRMARDVRGSASIGTRIAEAQATVDRTQATLDAAIKGYATAGLSTEPSAIQALRDLRTARDEALDAQRLISRSATALEISTADDWDDMTLEARRNLVQVLIERVLVTPGSRPNRVSIETREIAVAA